MSKQERDMLKIVEDVLENKLKSIVHILQMNQPTETSRVVSLVKQEIQPIKVHLSNQDIKLEEMNKKIDELKPLGKSIRFFNALRDFSKWITPYGILIGLITAVWKWLK